MDNYAAHKRVEVRDWLAANPRIHVHFTPTSGSWLNLVEVWFGIIERQAIHRGTFGSVKDLNAKIRAFINGWNDRCHPFVWTKTADEILKKANRQQLQKRPTRLRASTATCPRPARRVRTTGDGLAAVVRCTCANCSHAPLEHARRPIHLHKLLTCTR